MARGGELIFAELKTDSQRAVSPSGEAEGGIPSGDPGEEMAAVVSFKVIGSNFLDASFVDIASHNQP